MDNPNILVVDDEQRLAQFICRAADKLGHRAVAVHEVSEIAAAYQPSIRLVMLDLVMPGSQPSDTFRTLSECSTPGESAQLVLMSGHDDSVLQQAKMEAESQGLTVTGTLQKPFRLQNLQTLFSDLL